MKKEAARKRSRRFLHSQIPLDLTRPVVQKIRLAIAGAGTKLRRVFRRRFFLILAAQPIPDRTAARRGDNHRKEQREEQAMSGCNHGLDVFDDEAR